MKNQKSDTPNLQFFNDSTIRDLLNQIDNIILKLDSAEISPAQAETLLCQAGKDSHVIFWQLVQKISQSRHFVRQYNDYTGTIGHKPGLYLTSASPATRTLINHFNDYQEGKIDKKDWSNLADRCINALHSEIKSVTNELKNLIKRKNPVRLEVLNTDMVLDYSYDENDVSEDELRVQFRDPGDVADDIYSGRVS